MPNDSIQTPDILKNDYAFVRLLGEGTNGKTWLAKRLSDGQQVAVKVMKFALAENFKSYELFCREAQVMKSLNIPGVPKFYECQAGDASSLSYIIQEYIPYPSLQSIVKERGKLDENTTFFLLEELADIIYQLQTNYAPPVIHRDIKPSNILCDLDAENPKVKLIDFGAVANPQKRSEKSTIAGTFGYMAPEQMLNDVVIQSDYYALGAVALYALTGIEPGELGSLESAFEIDYKSAIKEHAPETSEGMIKLIGRLLNPVASMRPANSIALIDEIQSAKNGEIRAEKQNILIATINSLNRNLLKLIARIRLRKKYIFVLQSSYEKWPTTEGVIRRLMKDPNSEEKYIAEYTFDANERTWCGFFSISNENKNNSHCVVRYDPNDPRLNYLVL